MLQQFVSMFNVPLQRAVMAVMTCSLMYLGIRFEDYFEFAVIANACLVALLFFNNVNVITLLAIPIIFKALEWPFTFFLFDYIGSFSAYWIYLIYIGIDICVLCLVILRVPLARMVILKFKPDFNIDRIFPTMGDVLYFVVQIVQLIFMFTMVVNKALDYPFPILFDKFTLIAISLSVAELFPPFIIGYVLVRETKLVKV